MPFRSERLSAAQNSPHFPNYRKYAADLELIEAQPQTFAFTSNPSKSVPLLKLFPVDSGTDALHFVFRYADRRRCEPAPGA
jgi:hypothetical protein